MSSLSVRPLAHALVFLSSFSSRLAFNKRPKTILARRPRRRPHKVNIVTARLLLRNTEGWSNISSQQQHHRRVGRSVCRSVSWSVGQSVSPSVRSSIRPSVGDPDRRPHHPSINQSTSIHLYPTTASEGGDAEVPSSSIFAAASLLWPDDDEEEVAEADSCCLTGAK